MRISDWSSDVCSSDLEQGDGTTQNYQLSWGIGGDGPLQIVVGGNYVKQDPINAVDRAISRFPARSEERRVGKACVSTCRSRWSAYAYNKKKFKLADVKVVRKYSCIQQATS